MKIEISIEEYKELLEIKGRYEELKNRPVEIRYVYVNEPKPIDTTPKVTWSYLAQLKRGTNGIQE